MTLPLSAPAPEPLTYEFRLDAAEALRASRLLIWSGWRRWLWRGFPVFVVVLFLLAWWGGMSRAALARYAAVVVVLAVALPRVERWQLARGYARMPSLRVPQRFTFDAAGLRIAGAASAITLGWDAVVGARETPEFFFVLVGPRRGYYVPKRAVGGPEAEARLRALLRAHLGDRAAPLA